MNSLSALSFVLGAGVGAGIAFIIWLIFGRPRPAAARKPVQDSTVYFGQDYYSEDGRYYRDERPDDDHPHDIERAASHRYDGVTKDEYGNSYLSSGLDFGRFPR